jgi:hypothetical protein
MSCLPQIGDCYLSPRGREYRVLRHEGKKVVLWSEMFKREDTAIPELMVAENGWTRMSASAKSWCGLVKE